MSFPTREQVLALIEEQAPERLRQCLVDNLKPAIGIVARPVEEAQLEVGVSKIGSAPDVPRGFEWPMWNGKPLGFVAQFNLEHVAAFDLEHVLPPGGTLSFFYAIEEQLWGFSGDAGAWRVLWWPREAELERRALPFEAGAQNTLPPCAVEFGIGWTLPDVSTLDLADPDFSAAEVVNQFWEMESVLRALEGDAPQHRLLGLASAVQNPVEQSACEEARGPFQPFNAADAARRARALEEGRHWRLLFQLDSQADASGKRDLWLWGDAGMIYFCAHADDLAARRFDRVWLQLQCG